MSKITRRRFFEESMIATAAAAAASGTCHERLLGAESNGVSASDTIRHAVIGCRIRGKVHAREFARQSGVEIAYVCDPDRRLAAALAEAVEQEQGRAPEAIQDMRYVFDDPSVDTVSIAAPNHWHALAAIWAMQADKDVYVEKPVSHNVQEGRRIVQMSRKTGRLCQAGTQRRSSGALAAAAQFIRQGRLGEVTLARSIIYGQRGSIGSRGNYEVPTHVDYNLWLGPAPMRPLSRPQLHYDWHWVWDTGNGELGNNNIHIVDVCRWLMGLEGLGESVISIGGRLGYEDAGETPNTQIVVHGFGKHTIVQEVRGLKTDPYSDKFRAGWVVHGTEGFIAETSFFDPHGKLVQTFQGKNENHFANFIKAVRGGKREILNADIAEGHQSSALCHVGNISYRLGQMKSENTIAKQLQQYNLHESVPETLARMTSHLRDNGLDLDRTKLAIGPLLQIDSDNESFVDNRAANGLLSREYRKPFVVPGENEI